MKSTMPSLFFRILALTLFGLGCGITAQAHPGHELFHHGAVHALTSPYHLLVVSALGSAAIMLARWVKDSKTRRTIQFAGAFAVALALAGWLVH